MAMISAQQKQFFSQCEGLSFQDFSAKIWQKLQNPSSFPVDSFLQESFQEEFDFQGFLKSDQALFLEQKILQTSHHLTPTLGPTFLGIDCLCLAEKPKKNPYFVGVYSTIPFHNNAWSGSFSFHSLPLEKILNPNGKAFVRAQKSIVMANQQGAKDKKIHLIPPKKQHQLVFHTPMVDFLGEIYAEFQPEIKDKLPPPDGYEFYSQWALVVCNLLQRQILSEPRLYYFDLTEVIFSYLQKFYLLQTHTPSTGFCWMKIFGKFGFKLFQMWFCSNIFLWKAKRW